MLPEPIEDHSACRHVDSHGECFCGKEHFHHPPSEQNLHHLLENWQQAAVMHTLDDAVNIQKELDLSGTQEMDGVQQYGINDNKA